MYEDHKQRIYISDRSTIGSEFYINLMIFRPDTM